MDIYGILVEWCSGERERERRGGERREGAGEMKGDEPLKLRYGPTVQEICLGEAHEWKNQQCDGCLSGQATPQFHWQPCFSPAWRIGISKPLTNVDLRRLRCSFSQLWFEFPPRPPKNSARLISAFRPTTPMFSLGKSKLGRLKFRLAPPCCAWDGKSVGWKWINDKTWCGLNPGFGCQ